MSRPVSTCHAFLVAALLGLCTTIAGLAQERGVATVARVVPEDSRLSEDWRGRTHLALALSGGVPWRASTVDDPMRVVLDFREVDFAGIDLAAFDTSEAVARVSAGPLRAGWSRMVLELAVPRRVARAEMSVNGSQAMLRLRLDETTPEGFAASVDRGDAASRDRETAQAPFTPDLLPDVFTVVIDPGHGGIDPGAIRNGVEEADLVLRLALDLEDALLRAGGTQVVLTRREDVFVSLERRVAIAAQARGHAFISLHADALEEGVAQGATVYTLSDTASDAASAALAERHNRVDLLAGLDLTRADDEVAQVLLDLARQDSAQRSDALARAIVAGITGQGNRMHGRPLQQAGFSVLKSAEIPSVLIEAAFLSTDADLERLQDPVWRALMVEGIRDGLFAWADADRAVAPLRRK